MKPGIIQSQTCRGNENLVISYGGIINHPLEQVGKEQARGYSQTMGKIADEGIYLSEIHIGIPYSMQRL